MDYNVWFEWALKPVRRTLAECVALINDNGRIVNINEGTNVDDQRIVNVWFNETDDESLDRQITFVELH